MNNIQGYIPICSYLIIIKFEHFMVKCKIV